MKSEESVRESGVELPSGGSAESGVIQWVGDYPITRNKTVCISLLAVSTISVGLVALLLVGLAVQEGNYEFASTLMKVLAGIWLAFTLLNFLVGLVLFGGKVPMEVVIDDKGVTQAIRSKRMRAANALSVLGGAAVGGARGATAAGAGMIAHSREVESYPYEDLREAKGNPDTGEIRLWDSWHTVLQIFAPGEHYGAAKQRIDQGIAASASKRSAPQDIPGAVKALVITGALVFGGFLLVDFPLDFHFAYVLPLVALTVATILTRPPWRQRLGWILAGSVVLSVGYLFQSNPPYLGEAGAGLVLVLQLLVIGLFALFGVSAGLGVFNPNPTPDQP